MQHLPRSAYWIIGAAIACGGAIAARLISDSVPEYRIPIWFTGVAIIFVGLSVVSLGTKARLRGKRKGSP